MSQDQLAHSDSRRLWPWHFARSKAFPVADLPPKNERLTSGLSSVIRNVFSRHPASPAMPRRSFRVGRSFTGLGLFAIRPIKKREKITEYKGPRVSAEEAGRLERRGNRYLYEINPRVTIDGTPRGNVARYANHSCNPNAETYT